MPASPIGWISAAATANRCFVLARIVRAPAIAPVIVVATVLVIVPATPRGRVIALVLIAAIARARPIAPKAVVAAQRVAVTAPRLPIAAATPRAAVAVAAAP